MEGFIFTCNRDTYRECIQKKIFGLPSRFLGEVTNIKPTTPLFLFNATTKELLCGFEARCYGGKNICSSAFRGRFPAQVRVNIKDEPVSLTDTQYRSVGINDDQTGKIKQQLAANQVLKLLDLAGLSSAGGKPRDDKLKPCRTGSNARPGKANGLRLGGPGSEPRKKARTMVPLPGTQDNPGKHDKPPDEATESFDLCVGSQGRVGSDRTTAESGNPIADDTGENMNSDADSALGACIGAEAVANWGWQGETRTTVAVHPLPDSSTLSARGIVNLLDVCSRDCYRFLYIKEYVGIGRVLHVDFLSVADVMKFRCGVAGRTWKDLSNSSCSVGERITVRFWDRCQGLEKLREVFAEDMYLHVGEPYCCPKLADDVPLFFMHIPRKDPLAAASINDRLQLSSGSLDNCTPDCTDSPVRMSEPSSSGSQSLVNQFDFSSLHKRLGKDSDQQAKIEEEVRVNVARDIAELKGIKQLLHKRYDPHRLLASEGGSFFKNVLEIVDDEISKHEEELSDLDILG